MYLSEVQAKPGEESPGLGLSNEESVAFSPGASERCTSVRCPLLGKITLKIERTCHHEKCIGNAQHFFGRLAIVRISAYPCW